MPKISEMYAFVTSDRDESDEGVVGAQLHNGQWMPLVGADMQRAESLKDVAQRIANEHGKPIKLLKFTVREQVEIINPQYVD